MSFPPLHYATNRLAKINGCNMSAPPTISFRNGTKGNSTVCKTWNGCEANVTACLSDGGHTWYGHTPSSAASGDEMCRYEFWCVRVCASAVCCTFC